jgi:4-amino-4-deoxy-L-arabinose transferase-like glycosyltransferase
MFGNSKKLAIFIAILLIALGLRLYCFHGYWGVDDGEYALLANAMAKGNFTEFVNENYIRHYNGPAHLPFRVGLIVPLAAIFRVFGVTEFTFVSYPLAISMLSTVLAFCTGRLLFGVNAGLIAAAIWAVLPLDYDLATVFLPDAIASFYASLGVVALLYARELDTTDAWKRSAWGLIIGLSFGISWLSKESVIYLAPLCGFLLIVDAKNALRKTLPLWIGVAVGSAGILLAEMITYKIRTGDLLLRMHETERMYQQTKAYLFYEGSRFGWPVGGSQMQALVKRLFLEGPTRIFLNERFCFVPFLGLVAVARASYLRDRSFFLPGIWMITLAFVYNFASTSFSSYTPLVMYHRNLHPIALPAVVLTAALIVRLLWSTSDASSDVQSRERFFWGAVVSAIVIVTGGYVTLGQMRDRSTLDSIREIRQVAAVIAPTETVYTDPLSSKALEFFWNYRSSVALINFEGMRAADIRPKSFVLVDRFRLDWLKVNVSMWLTKDYGYREPEFSTNPAGSWTKIWRNENATLYRVD